MMRGGLVCCLMASLLWSPASWGAGAGALDLYKKGLDLYNEGEFAASLRALQLARRTAEVTTLQARIELYIGLNRVILGQKKLARRAFAAALVHDPDLKLDPQRFKRELIERFAAVRRGLHGALSVTATVPAELWIDGKNVGAVGLRRRQIRAPIGKRRLEFVALAGGARMVKRVVVGAKQTVEVRAALPLPKPAAPTPGPSSSATDAASHGRRRWVWISAAGAAVAAGVALGLYAAASSQHDEFRALADKEARQRGLDATDGDRIDDLGGSIRAKLLGANISLGLAGALAVTSAVLFFVEGRRPSRVAKVAGAGGGLTVSFGKVLGLRYGARF